MKSKAITYQEIDIMMLSLIERIRESNRSFQEVVGIANGGLYISNKIAKELGLPHKQIRISCYQGFSKPKPIIETYDQFSSNVLIVDDLIDGGETMRIFEEMFGMEDSAVAVLFWKPGSFREPEFYVEEKPDEWIDFPWE